MTDDDRYRRPESVLVVVVDPENFTLLLKRRDLPDFWQSVTGSLDRGETAARAARRELVEETGITEGELVGSGMVRRFEILPVHRARYRPGVVHNLEHEFFCRLDGRPEIRIDPVEHEAFCWLPIEVAAARAWSWTNRQALESLIRRG